MGREGHPADVLDSGALIALERGDERVRRLIRRARETGAAIVIPATVLAEVWRDGARQARVAALVGQDTTKIEVLDEGLAKATGVLCGRTGTSDIVDASVVITARLHGALVVTTDPEDLLALDPHLAVEAL